MASADSFIEKQSDAFAKAFESAEASLRLEGLDHANDARYRILKEQVIAGTMSVEAAIAEFDTQFGLAKVAAIPA